MDRRFSVDGNVLAAHLSRPLHLQTRSQPGVVIAHGFPAETGGATDSLRSFPDLADRVATEYGWAALAYASRGVAGSEGSFSLRGWLRDLRGAIGYLRDSVPVNGVWIVGFETGGALAIQASVDDPEIRGVASVSAPADFGDWAKNPRKLLVLARELGIVDSEIAEPFREWADELGLVSAVKAAAQLAPRELMVLHGSDDDVVPLLDARAVADSHGMADLRVVHRGGHQLRHDPRAIAILLGWLDRQRNLLIQAVHG